MEGFRQGFGPTRPKSLATQPTSPNNAYFRHSHRVRTVRTQRSSFRFRNATRVS